MHLRLVQMYALLLLTVAAPSLCAGTVTFAYTAPNVGVTAVSGMGSFSYIGSLASITLGDLTSFAFELDLSTPGAIINPAIFEFGLPDLMSFSASVSGGVVTALSLATGYESASNTGSFNENQKNLVVTSLAPGGAANYNEDEVLNRVTLFDTGTITAQGPEEATPEPSTALLVGCAALSLAFRSRTRRAPRG